MSDEVADLLAKLFIARTDVKAIQHQNGIYTPHVRRIPDSETTERLPWTREDLNKHLASDATFGHYLLNEDGNCKLITFDVDLNKAGYLPDRPMPGSSEPGADVWAHPDEIDQYFATAIKPVDDLRGAWHDRSHVGRTYMKRQFMEIANVLARTIKHELDLPVAVTYSGNKGIHVYAFTGLLSGYDARLGANIVLDSMDMTEPLRGSSFFKFKDNEYANFCIEIFPKQDEHKGPEHLGNLVRLPLGRNLKNPSDPTFFIDLSRPLNEMSPLDPVFALTEGAIDPWRGYGE